MLANCKQLRMGTTREDGFNSVVSGGGANHEKQFLGLSPRLDPFLSE